MTYSDRLKELRKIHKLTQKQFAEIFDIGLSTLAMWESSQRRPPAPMLVKIAEHFGVTVGYLLGVENKYTSTDSILLFPVLAGVKAGFNSAIETIESGDYQEIPRSILNGKKPEDLLVFLVDGDSMYPKFLDGDRVLVSRQTSVDSGDIAIVSYSDFQNGTIKKVHYEPGCDYVDLIPLNPTFTPVRIQGDDVQGVRVIGKVIYLFRKI